MLYIDLRPGQTYHSKDIFRWRGRAWLTNLDKVKSRGTVIDWCTGREWHVNCMTVISAWWRSNMTFQRLSGWWNYYITRWRQEVSYFWRPDPLVTRCGRERQHSAESWAPGPPVEQPWRTRKAQRWWLQEWGSICCSSVRSPTLCHSKTLSNSFEPFQIKWEVYFSKNCVDRLYCVVVMILHAHVDVYVLCVCIDNRGHGYTTRGGVLVV